MKAAGFFIPICPEAVAIQKKELTFASVRYAKRHGKRTILPGFCEKYQPRCGESGHVFRFFFVATKLQQQTATNQTKPENKALQIRNYKLCRSKQDITTRRAPRFPSWKSRVRVSYPAQLIISALLHSCGKALNFALQHGYNMAAFLKVSAWIFKTNFTSLDGE